MKKTVLYLLGLVIILVFCLNQSVNAAKKPIVIKSPVSTIKISAPLNNLKFFDKGVGYMNDPSDSSILYVIFGDSSGTALTIVKVYVSGVLQSGSGVTVSGVYSTVGAGIYRVTGTITVGQTSFSCSGIYDMN